MTFRNRQQPNRQPNHGFVGYCVAHYEPFPDVSDETFEALLQAAREHPWSDPDNKRVPGPEFLARMPELNEAERAVAYWLGVAATHGSDTPPGGLTTAVNELGRILTALPIEDSNPLSQLS